MLIIVASVLGIVGAFLVAFGKGEGYILWMFTNSLWFLISDNIYAQAMWATFFVSSIIGFYKAEAKKCID